MSGAPPTLRAAARQTHTAALASNNIAPCTTSVCMFARICRQIKTLDPYVLHTTCVYGHQPGKRTWLPEATNNAKRITDVFIYLYMLLCIMFSWYIFILFCIVARR